ncbi:MAG: hypothetical protein ACN4GK_11850 [Acidimicrobiia bacterium]
MLKRFAPISVLVMLISLLPALPAMAQPSNDNFAGASLVGSVPFADSVEIFDATTEPGEPIEVCAPIANTVWYTLTLDQASTLLIDTAGSGFDTVLAVWQGTAINELSLVKCVDDTSLGVESGLLLSADAGVTYLIQAGAFYAAPEAATLSISIGEPPKSTGKPVTYKGTSKGNMAQASIEEYNDGSSTWTSVALFDGRAKYVRGAPYKSSEVNVYRSSSSYDDSTGIYIWESWYGSAPLELGRFELDTKLRSARIDTSVILFGSRCEEGPYNETDDGVSYEVNCTDLGAIEVVAAVTWTGQGPTYRYSYNERSSSSDGYRGTYGYSSTARDAVVIGSIVGTEWSVDMGGAYGTLQKDSNRTMTVFRGLLAY